MDAAALRVKRQRDPVDEQLAMVVFLFKSFTNKLMRNFLTRSPHASLPSTTVAPNVLDYQT